MPAVPRSLEGAGEDTGARPPRSRLLRVTLVATLALAPLEGYLQDVDANLGKVAPALFLVTWLVGRLARGRPVGVSHPVVWCAVGLVPLVLASTAVNLDNGYALSYAIRWLPFLLLVVALVDVLTRDVDPWVGLYALVAGAAASAAGAVVSFAFLGSPRATGPLEDPNDLAYVITAAVPIVLLAVRKAARPLTSLAWGAVLALLLVGALATLSRGGIIATTLVLVWALARGLVPARFLAAAGALLAALAVPILVLAQDVVQQALDQKTYIAASNVDTRLLRWQAAARMLADNPLLGVGPGGFRGGYVEYSGFAELAELTPVAHEMYLEVGAELGLTALLLFVGGIVAALVASENAVRRRRADRAAERDPWLLAALAVQGSLLAVCVSSVFLSEQYYMPLWAGLAIAAALDLRSRTGDPGRERRAVDARPARHR
ncbi:O-antigen ligase [Geodermatophilus dictyosporus]|uniref:O-antigen ligase n=1 Tax=Geodermatophilus dictyosporus TaxID=1523247 RepID=A0A1I5JWK6_9ACTN|nr:O-antigen ligase family protein [Geodermatophilus dictyosporus]SFO77155.1 O-antigen ligase [Geodermatophilus dictyosporus]